MLGVIEGVCVGEGVPVIEGVLDGVGENPPAGTLHVNVAPEPAETYPGRHSHLEPVMSTPSGMNVEFAAEQMHEPFSNVGEAPAGHDLQVAALSLSWYKPSAQAAHTLLDVEQSEVMDVPGPQIVQVEHDKSEKEVQGPV